MQKTLFLVSPRGFCAGVARAIKVVEDAIEIFGAPVYVKHEIVHNKHVVSALEKKGAVTVDELAKIPDGAVVVFSAHGSTPLQYEEVKRRGMRLIDATCPLVTKVHLEVHRFLKEGYTIVYIGHKGHIEGIGVLAEAAGIAIPVIETVADVASLEIGNPEKLVYLTQTTLSVDDTKEVVTALRGKYPHIIAPPIEDICYATTNRQEAVRHLAEKCDTVLVFGSTNSSNSRRLAETARDQGVSAYLVDDMSSFDTGLLSGSMNIGITAGASAPEEIVSEAVDFFRERGFSVSELVVKEERMVFSEPLDMMRIKKERQL